MNTIVFAFAYNALEYREQRALATLLRLVAEPHDRQRTATALYRALIGGPTMHQTVTVLTVDLPSALSERLRLTCQRHPGLTPRDIALEALEEWLAKREQAPDQELTASRLA